MSFPCTEMSVSVKGCCNVCAAEIQPDSVEVRPSRFAIISASFILFDETRSQDKEAAQFLFSALP